MAERLVGVGVPRKEGLSKVAGETTYVDDLSFDGMLHGATIRSPVPRGRIVGLRFEGDIPWDEFVVVTAADIPGDNVVALIVDDQPLLADGVVNHVEEAVALIAHPDRHLVQVARRHVVVDVEPLPHVASIEEAESGAQVVWGEDNVQKALSIDKGDVDAAFARSDVIVVEGEYRTGAQEQLYIEPQGMIAKADPTEGVTVWGSMQCPYYVHKALVRSFGLDEQRVRVVQTATGGAFGGKEEYPSIIAGHAALLAHKAGQPVKLVYDRAEDMLATPKRHPSRTRHRTALTRDGQLVALDIDFVLDGGAYATLSAVVLSRGVIHAAGPYACDNIKIRGRALATNLPPYGAFRGFGAPQSCFALERQLDRCAQAVGISPVEIRRRNLLGPGQSTATGQVIEDPIPTGALLDLALERADWDQKKAAFAVQNADPMRSVKRGLGVSTFFHGSGFTGSGETYLASVIKVRAQPNGRVAVLASSTEMGQGTNTIFSQIAAQALGIPFDWIEVVQPDTSKVPNSGPTVASRTAMIVGKLLESACLDLRGTLQAARLLGKDHEPEQFARACAVFLARHARLEASAQYQAPPHVKWDDERYRGAAYGAFAWAAYVAEVSVDTTTCEVRVDSFTTTQDIGEVLNPVLAEGQIEGGVAQAIGYALYEDVVMADGHMANPRMTDYIMPTSADLPDIGVHFLPVPYAYGPSGAKGVGELPFDGPAPAIVQAIEDAVGVSLETIPVTPEVLMVAFAEAGEDSERGGGHGD